MKSSLAFLTFPLLTLSHPQPALSKRQICSPIPPTTTSPLADDAPTINAALQECGSRGTVHLAANTTWTIRSPIDLSPCQACLFQIDSHITIDPTNSTYWKTHPSVFKIANATAVVIRSGNGGNGTGIIDAQNLGTNIIDPINIPKLFSIEDHSENIYISNLRIRNVTGRAFSIGSGSKGVHISSITMETDTATAVFEVATTAEHVYLYSNTMRASYTCVSINWNTSNVQVQDSTCMAASGRAIQLQYTYSGGAAAGLQWIRNVLVKGLKTVGKMYVVDVAADSLFVQTGLELWNATFEDVSIGGVARRAAIVREYKGRLNASDVVFRGWEGVEEESTSLVCQNSVDTCEFKTEDWNVVKQ